MSHFVMRVIGASVLDRDTYEEVEHQPRALHQALAVVVLASVAGTIGIGAWQFGSATLVFGAMAVSIALWLAWAMLAFQIGTHLLPERHTHASWAQLLRTTGFAAAPGFVQAMAVFSPEPGLVFVAALLWMTAAMVVALQQALDYRQTWRAIAVVLISGSIVAVTTALLTALLARSLF